MYLLFVTLGSPKSRVFRVRACILRHTKIIIRIYYRRLKGKNQVFLVKNKGENIKCFRQKIRFMVKVGNSLLEKGNGRQINDVFAVCSVCFC